MDVSQLQHDKEYILSSLKTLSDHSVIATRKIEIFFPKKFEEHNLAEIYDSVSCIGLVGIVANNKYACLGVLSKFTFLAGDVSELNINGEAYVSMKFEPGETIIETLYVPADPLITYDYFLEFIKFSRIPWYIDFETLLSVIDESKQVAGSFSGSCAQVIRVLLSLTCRDPDNPDVEFRYGNNINNFNVKPLIIGMNNPGQLLTGTFARFSGGYLSDNTIAGIQEGPTEITELEKILKGIVDD